MKNKDKIVSVINLILFISFGILTITFTMLYTEKSSVEWVSKYSLLINVFVTVFICAIVVLGILFKNTKNDVLYKLGFTTEVFVACVLIVLYVLNVTGLWNKIDSIEDLRDYVESFGGNAVMIFIIMQFLQVAVLPIPGVVAIGAGVALFGPFYGALYSLIGILLGSFFAFFVGRKLGYKVASWIAGKENIDKGLKLIKGKDKVILTLMFLLPFFPDDVLCFVAGLSTMSNQYFIIMIIITRIISTFTSAYSLNGNLIPYNTWWGILLWCVLFLVTGVFAFIVYKNGDKIENFFRKHKKDNN